MVLNRADIFWLYLLHCWLFDIQIRIFAKDYWRIDAGCRYMLFSEQLCAYSFPISCRQIISSYPPSSFHCGTIILPLVDLQRRETSRLGKKIG
jgi:hypothetical protein